MTIDTAFFVISLIFVGIGVFLLLDHYRSHRGDASSLAQLESCACVCYFQLSDISSRETWIVVSLTNAISLGISSYIYLPDTLTPAAMLAVFFALMCAILFSETCWSQGGDDALKHRLTRLRNHETWIVVCFTNAFSIGVIAPLFSFVLT